MSTWKYMQNGQQCGPVETAALLALLNNGTLSPETQVLKEGTTNWVPMGTVPEFSGGPQPTGAQPTAPASPSGPLPGSPPPPATDTEVPEPADVEKNKVFAVLAYVGILFLVPLLAAPQSKFARYHTNQGVVLFLATLVCCVGSAILSLIPFLGCIIWAVVMGGALVMMILGIINAAGGHCKPLPLIGQFKLIK